MNSDTVMNRMGDVVIALAEASKARVCPTKIQLQKFVYLSDVLGQVVGQLRLREGYKVYRNGPYDSAVQNAVDSLAFRGIVRIVGVWRTPSGHLGTSYTLAEPGQKLLERIQGSDVLKRKIQIADLVGEELRKFGWDRIIDLVYAEPTFVALRPYGWGSQLVTEDGLSVSAAFVLAIMRRVAGILHPDSSVSAEWFTNRFFAYLNDYDEQYGAELRPSG